MKTVLTVAADGTKTYGEESFLAASMAAFTNPWSEKPSTMAQTAIYTSTCVIGGMYLGKMVDKYLAEQGKSVLGFGA